MEKITLILLVVEILLILLTLGLLALHSREGRHRSKLIEELIGTRKVLSRQEYFNEVLDVLSQAKQEVFGCISGTYPVSQQDKELVNRIEQEIARLTKTGVKVQYLLPKLPDRLFIGSKYSQSGAEISYSHCLFFRDCRYMVVDNKYVIIGVPEISGEGEPVRKGYTIPSQGLAFVLKEHFVNCSGDILTYEDYLNEVISDMSRGVDHIPIEALSRELKIEPEEIRKIIKA